MISIERAAHFLNGVLTSKRKIINITFFALVSVNLGTMIFLSVKGQWRLAASAFLIYFVQTFLSYLVAMYAAQIVIRRETRRLGRLPLLPQIVAVGLIFVMFIGQAGWLQNIYGWFK